jgi:outer membrane protein assembly factor BamB
MDHYVYALDRRSGRLRWRFDTGSPVLASAAAIGNTVCVGANRAIHGIESASGKQRWRLDAGSFFQSRAAAAGNRFILGGWDNTLYCVEADTGAVVWREQMGRTNGGRGRLSFYYSPAISSPTVADGYVYVCTNDGVLHALSLGDGRERWTARAPAGGDTLGYSSPLVSAGRVYVGGLGDKGQGDCYAYDAASGELVWRCSTGADNYDSSPAMVGGLIAIGSVQGRVTWIEPRTGAVLASFRARPGYSFSSPVGDGARTYIGSLNGTVTAMSTPVGADHTTQRSIDQ